MLFNSLTFILFFILVVFLHYILPHKFRWIMLLVASCIFYMCWRAELIVLILFISFLNYISAILIEIYPNRSKLILILCLILDFGFLFIFKYMVFISDSFRFIYEYFGWVYPVKQFSIILPMGISFYTFQAAGYTIDIYRKEYRAERNYFKFALFVTFFPQLVAGPIERADRLLNQLFKRKYFNVDNFVDGIKLMLLGYFKKIVISDRASVLVDTVYNNPQQYEGIPLIFATVFFTFQIYGDFSGYTDIARGCAKILGIDLMKNFDRPYFATSIKDFWRRWHISLSTWFRDYLYIPLGGSRCSVIKKYRNIMITFLVSGLWHGANWTFVLWGGLHGAYQVIGDIKNKILPNTDYAIFKPFKIIITFILVMFAWIFFRSNNISDCFYIIQNLTTNLGSIADKQYLYETFNNMGLQLFEILLVCGSIAILYLSDLVSYKYDIHDLMNKVPFPIRFAYYYLLIIIILAIGVFSGGGEFIYFQF